MFLFHWSFPDCLHGFHNVINATAIILGQHRLDEEPGVVVSLGDLDMVHAEHVLLEGAVLDEAVVAVGAHVLLLARMGHPVVSVGHELV